MTAGESASTAPGGPPAARTAAHLALRQVSLSNAHQAARRRRAGLRRGYRRPRHLRSGRGARLGRVCYLVLLCLTCTCRVGPCAEASSGVHLRCYSQEAVPRRVSKFISGAGSAAAQAYNWHCRCVSAVDAGQTRPRLRARCRCAPLSHFLRCALGLTCCDLCTANRIAQAFAQEMEQLIFVRNFSDRLPTASERALQKQVASVAETLAA